MADVDHPKTHVEDQEDVTLPRTQPESPKHEGIDPLTESDTMYPAHETKSESEKLARRELKDEPTEVDEGGVVADQTAVGEDAQPGDVVSESADNLAQVDKARAEEEPANADGKLPKDSQKANHKSSDKQNTSPSNKPATTDEPHDGSGSSDGEPTRGSGAAKSSTRASSKR